MRGNKCLTVLGQSENISAKFYFSHLDNIPKMIDYFTVWSFKVFHSVNFLENIT